MELKKIRFYYGLLAGLGMIGYWSYGLVNNLIPEMETEPMAIKAHILAELLTGLMLVVGGFLVKNGSRCGKDVYLTALGMLLYTVIVSPGYYVERREFGFVMMFLVLIGLTALMLFSFIKEKKQI